MGRSKLIVLLVVAFLVVVCGGGTDSPVEPTAVAGDFASGVPVRPTASGSSPTPIVGASSGVASPTPAPVPSPTSDSSVVASPAPVPTATHTPTPSQEDLVDLARRRFAYYWETDFSKTAVAYGEIISGGPPRDGIPPIYDPQFETVEQANEWMLELEPVIVVQIGDDVRAYSQILLVSHEIVDDVVGGKPIAVTWCPLCNTSLVFSREVDGKVLTFGVSGMLRQSNMIMWDHETESWWQQGTAEAIVGEMTGTKLDTVASQVVTWRDFKASFPDGKVLSKEGSIHGYNPYYGYDTSFPFLYFGPENARLPTMERVIGIALGTEARAYPYTELSKERVVQERLGERNVVLFYEPSALSTLGASQLTRARSVGTATVFVPRVADQDLTFEFRNGAFMDRETGSTWNILGEAIDGSLVGEKLPPLFHTQGLWFYWAAAFEGTSIYTSPA